MVGLLWELYVSQSVVESWLTQIINDMPQYFNEAVNAATNQAGSVGHDEPAVQHEVEINQLHRSFAPSYNIPPTRTALIMYKRKEDASKFILEPLSFGLLPFWAKPNDPTAVSRQGEDGPQYSKEIQGFAGRFFNCRKESLDLSVWKSARHNRCVVPIEGYFEWQKSKVDKIPYYVHSDKRPLIFLAGFFSHNTNYSGKDPEYLDAYLSTFTILTGPAQKSDTKDISWLHPRKPLMLLPGTRAWNDWLDPSKEWSDSLVAACLETKKNPAYLDLSWYTVNKTVGNPGYNGEEAIKEVKNLPQKSILLFFNAGKRLDDSGGSPRKKVKQETGVKREAEESRAEDKLKQSPKKLVKKAGPMDRFINKKE